ncbi:unnamed protein product [Amoebophrya sp. A25]|nr:unnamed protein product [Amoebophrya sp. A25]|eukprot:GSA25T00017290001.1
MSEVVRDSSERSSTRSSSSTVPSSSTVVDDNANTKRESSKRQSSRREPAGVESPHGSMHVAVEHPDAAMPSPTGAKLDVPASEQSNMSMGFSNASMQSMKASGVRGKADNGITDGVKDCGTGCYLCYKEDALGTVYMHWAHNTPVNAILWMGYGLAEGEEAPGKVAGFKFTQNGGRTEMGKNANNKGTYYKHIAGYISTLKKSPFKFNKITILQHVEQMPVFLKKSSSGAQQVFHMREAGKSIVYESEKILAIGVVAYNNTDFEVQTMDDKVFRTQCNAVGAVTNN